MKSITMHLVVAGATYFNQLDRFQGWSGMPLTKTGIDASQAVGRQLATVNFDLAFSSDLSRSVQTGRAVLAANPAAPALQSLSVFRAPFFGGFEGSQRAAVWSGFATKLGYASVAAFASDQTPSELQTLLHDHDADGLAESGAEFWQRYTAGLQQIFEQTPADGHVLLVVDGSILREIRYRATGKLVSPQQLVPSTVAVIHYNGDKFTLVEN